MTHSQLARPAPSPIGLTWAHIFGQRISIDDTIEALEPVSHGDGAGGFIAAVTGPATEPRNGPGGPFEAVRRMGILLFWGSPLQLLLQGTQNLDLSFVEHAAGGRPLAIGCAREHELHRDGCGDESDHGELFENLAILDDTLLNSQSLSFESSEQLLDVPAQAIPADHGEGLRDSLDPVRGQQPPQDRFLARSEEHTSELQSRENLVCRLLLE